MVFDPVFLLKIGELVGNINDICWAGSQRVGLPIKPDNSSVEVGKDLGGQR